MTRQLIPAFTEEGLLYPMGRPILFMTERNKSMNLFSKLILIAILPTLSALGADGSAENQSNSQAEKPSFSITAFTLKSSDGEMEMNMDAEGKMFIQGQHVATANPKGEIHTPAGELIMRVKESGELEPALFGKRVKVTVDGTITKDGAIGRGRGWEDGKWKVPGGHWEMVPKDSLSKQAATIFFLWGTKPIMAVE